MSSWLRIGSLSFLALGAIAACNADPPAGSSKPPTPGDVGAEAADTSFAAADPAPAGNGKKLSALKKADDKGDAKPPASVDPTMMDPTTFVGKEFCLMPKLSQCSAYGSRYERITSVNQFCATLGGERAGSCPEKDAVARCMTPANVLTTYYSTGEKPYTKASAEAKCNEKNWMVVP